MPCRALSACTARNLENESPLARDLFGKQLLRRARCRVRSARLPPRSDKGALSRRHLLQPQLHHRTELSRRDRRGGLHNNCRGPHASACYSDVARYADYVVVGEGEYTLPALLAAIEEGRDPPPGVATARGYTPARHTVLLDAYPPFSEVKGFIEITRGCPFGCGYCQTPRLFGRCMRHRSVDEISRYAARFRDIRFVTPNAFAYGSDGVHLRLDRVEQLLRSLDGRIYFGTFPGEVRPECVSQQSIDLILDYCANTRLHFGAQSGSDRVLRLLHRGHTVEDVVRAVDLCRENGLVPVVDFILGLPFETDDDQRATLDLVRLVTRAGKAHIHYFMPLPGTPLQNSRPRGLLPETEKVLGRLALGGRITGSWMDHEIRFFRRSPHL
ncbi:putative enzyme [Methanoculleus bourgensis]|uniref:Putative enzyme n=1 Tax=Methanoculleus bourgensis TaxID=83986 RepID=A0A0X3BNC5_9EURY|nr:putative enzyme [Methanoculleus bourgensis]